ncbi:geranylgeranylglycerol-phosphate geranylgeranyltransferase [Haladaptatus litoreus]|uniref:Digeranylgeranylglyceryl phosphate synthase n=1 Tax=Haladaptatus litoreus TaxID=553468 RepID=A0A1N7EIU9_9EURY|nr:geranylgeranylglycerol-phosphate geranylgeranyltransferase [Haladaptatus litoreus]SIR87967.1 geranylgeranylglycerol-phosphate geranylgeranyltransferase [Haladaptatus litoreus]
MSLVERARGLIELTRPGNAVTSGVLTFIGAFVADGGSILSDGGTVGAAVATTILATGGGMAINDYFDRDIDRINNPERPIPRGAVAPQTVLVFSFVLFAIAGVLAFMLPLLAAAIAVVNLIALVTYTEFFKGLPGVGNVLVSYLGGSTFLFGAAAVGQLSTPIVVLFLLAALSTFAREVIKDIEDLVGDREEGLNTLPIAIGERSALAMATAVLLVAIVASPVPYVLGTFGVAYLVIVAPAILVTLYAGYLSYTDPAESQSLLKYGMYISVAAFVVGRVTLLL